MKTIWAETVSIVTQEKWLEKAAYEPGVPLPIPIAYKILEESLPIDK